MKTATRTSPALLLAILLLPLSGAAEEHQVTLRDHQFQPAELTIKAGDSVRWTNAGLSPHNVRADDDSFRCSDSCGPPDDDGYAGSSPGAPSASAWSFAQVFVQVGEYRYHCEAHGSPGGLGMSGRITVVANDEPGMPSIPINAGLTGSWFNPATDGQGFLFEVVPDFDPPVVTLAWFTFDATAGGVDRQRWFTALGSYNDGDASVELTVYRTLGGVMDEASPAPTTSPVGHATLGFSSCTQGEFAYTLSLTMGAPPVQRTIPISRITPASVCEAMTQR